jgi:hypothetical protein
LRKKEMEENGMKRNILFGIAVLVLVAGTAGADSLSVKASAAMNGSNYGLEVVHDNASQAWVMDNTPDGETVYRFTFLFNTTATGATRNFRQAIFRGWGPNPHPGVGACPADAGVNVPFLQLWLYEIGGSGEVPTIQLWAKGNQCGDQGAKRINIPVATDVRVCGEVWTGASNTGGVALAIVNPGDACPASGDAAYETQNFSNNLVSLDFVRLGTPAVNTFGAGENQTLLFDEFESYRTLAP